MSILDTFVLLFKGDSSSLTKENKKVELSIEKVSEKVKETEETLKKLDEGIKESASSMEKMDNAFKLSDSPLKKLEKFNEFGVNAKQIFSQVAGVLSPFLAIDHLFENLKHASEYSRELYTASQELQVNTETLDAWRQAVVLSGGSAEAFQSTIGSLSKKFNLSSDNVISSLPKIAGLFAKLSRRQGDMLGEQLGIDAGTINFLRQGTQQIQEMVQEEKELGVVTKQQAELANKAHMASLKLEHGFRGVYLILSAFLSPSVISFYETLTTVTKYFNQHAEFLKGLLIGLGVLIGGYLIPLVFSLFNPWILLMGVVIGLFGILYDDFETWRKGGASVLGELIGRFEDFLKIVHAVEDEISRLFKMFSGSSIGKFIIGVSQTAVGYDDEISKNFNENLLETNRKYPNKMTQDFDTAVQKLTILPNIPSIQMLNTAASQKSENAYNQKSIQVNVGDVNIQSQATNSDELALNFSKVLNNHLSHTIGSYDDGLII